MTLKPKLSHITNTSLPTSADPQSPHTLITKIFSALASLARSIIRIVLYRPARDKGASERSERAPYINKSFLVESSPTPISWTNPNLTLLLSKLA